MQQEELLEKAQRIYQAENPEYELKALGVTSFQKVEERVIHADHPTLQRVIDIHVASWSFPKPIPFDAGFVREGLMRKLLKVFDNEPQVGDGTFDDRVFITTSDPEACLATLTERCQSSILHFVMLGGAVQVQDGVLTILLEAKEPGDRDEQFVIAAHFAQWVLGSD